MGAGRPLRRIGGSVGISRPANHAPNASASRFTLNPMRTIVRPSKGKPQRLDVVPIEPDAHVAHPSCQIAWGQLHIDEEHPTPFLYPTLGCGGLAQLPSETTHTQKAVPTGKTRKPR